MSHLVIIGICVMFLGNILHIVGVATTHWLDIDVMVITSTLIFRDVGVGLFKMCPGNMNTCLDMDHPSSSLEGVRALCILGVLLGFGAIGISVLWMLIKGLQSNKIIPLVWLASALGAFGFIIIGVIVYAAEEDKSDRWDLGYSFALSIVGALGIGAGGALSFLGGRASAS